MSEETQQEGPLTLAEEEKPAVAPQQASDDAEMEFSIFTDLSDVEGTGKPACGLEIPYKGYTFFCNRLDQAGIDHVTSENEGIEQDTKALRHLKGKAAKDASFAMVDRSVRKDRWVVDKCVTGWKHDRRKLPPFTPEMRDKVGLDVWATVADQIYSKSISGRAKEDNATNF